MGIAFGSEMQPDKLVLDAPSMQDTALATAQAAESYTQTEDCHLDDVFDFSSARWTDTRAGI